MSAPTCYPATILDQHHLIIMCSVALPSSCILSNPEAHKPQVSYPGLILHTLPCLMFPLPRLSCFERDRAASHRRNEKKIHTPTTLAISNAYFHMPLDPRVPLHIASPLFVLRPSIPRSHTSHIMVEYGVRKGVEYSRQVLKSCSSIGKI